MVRHWIRHLRTEKDPAKRSHMIRSRAINAFGAFFTGLVLVVVLVTKFTHGAWVALLGMVIFYATMSAIRKRYDRVAEEIAAPEGPSDDSVRPSRVHSVVLISKIHRPTLRALAYAKLMRSDTLERWRERRPGRDQGPARGVGAARHRRTAEGPRLAVPRDHPARHRVREGPAPGVPARRGLGHHPRVRGRPLVRASAAQPERAAAQGPAAVHARRDDDLERPADQPELQVARNRARKRQGVERAGCGAPGSRGGARPEESSNTKG